MTQAEAPPTAGTTPMPFLDHGAIREARIALADAFIMSAFDDANRWHAAAAVLDTAERAAITRAGRAADRGDEQAERDACADAVGHRIDAQMWRALARQALIDARMTHIRARLPLMEEVTHRWTPPTGRA